MTITHYTPEQIVEHFSFLKTYQARQIFEWISRGVFDFHKMTNLSKLLREQLSEKSTIVSSKILKKHVDSDGTIKLQIQLEDESIVETVLLIDKNNRKTACVSCQVGCPMKCAFCKTGTLGFLRNLTAAEIIEQFLYLEKEAGTLQNIVFMGMGEPLLNLPEIRTALNILSHPQGRKLSLRRITISTCGIISGIYDLADNGPPLRLAVSLTTANEELRTTLMPVTTTNPLKKLKEAIAYYTKKTGKRCTLELALLKNTNTDYNSAKKIINFATNLNTHVNLIPWNPIQELPFERPSGNECIQFENILKKAGLNVTTRIKRGNNISGACGQLGQLKKQT